MKRKKRRYEAVRSFQEEKNVLFSGTGVVLNSSAERLANPNSAFVTGTVNFCLDEITGHESSFTPRNFSRLFLD